MKKKLLTLLSFLHLPYVVAVATLPKPPISWTTPRYVWGGALGTAGLAVALWPYKKMKQYSYKVSLLKKLLAQKRDDKHLQLQLRHHIKKLRLYRTAFWAGIVVASAGAGVALDTVWRGLVAPHIERPILEQKRYKFENKQYVNVEHADEYGFSIRDRVRCAQGDSDYGAIAKELEKYGAFYTLCYYQSQAAHARRPRWRQWIDPREAFLQRNKKIHAIKALQRFEFGGSEKLW